MQLAVRKLFEMIQKDTKKHVIIFTSLGCVKLCGIYGSVMDTKGETDSFLSEPSDEEVDFGSFAIDANPSMIPIRTKHGAHLSMIVKTN